MNEAGDTSILEPVGRLAKRGDEAINTDVTGLDSADRVKLRREDVRCRVGDARVVSISRGDRLRKKMVRHDQQLISTMERTFLSMSSNQVQLAPLGNLSRFS